MKAFSNVRCAFALAAVVAGGAPTPAHATLVYVTYEGIVSADYFDNSPFGRGDLTGQHYTANYVFDVVFGLDNANCQNCSIGSGTYNFIEGGSYSGTTSPAVTASLTIGVTTVSLSNSYHGLLYGENNGLFTKVEHKVVFYGSMIDNSIYNSKGASGLPAALVLADYDYVVSDGDTAIGEFLNSSDILSLTPTSLHISTTPPGVSETPLPASLPLFASGLAGLGLLGWRRRRKTMPRPSAPPPGFGQ